MKIYTKSGDRGETGLLGGVRVKKSHPAVEVTGTIDETNSLLGTVRAHLGQCPSMADVGQVLTAVQHDLFDLGSRIAASLSDSQRAAAFPGSRIRHLEDQIDRFDAELPVLTAFILPGGSVAGSQLHLARSVCRRAERELVELIHSDDDRLANPDDPLAQELVYLNRLSDLLFVLARFVNREADCLETTWEVGRSEGG